MEALKGMLDKGPHLDAAIHSQIADWNLQAGNVNLGLLHREKALKAMPSRKYYRELCEGYLLAGALSEALRTGWEYHGKHPQEPPLLDIGKTIVEWYRTAGMQKELEAYLQSMAAQGDIIAKLALKNLPK